MGFLFALIIDSAIAIHIGLDHSAPIGWAVFSALNSLSAISSYLYEISNKLENKK